MSSASEISVVVVEDHALFAPSFGLLLGRVSGGRVSVAGSTDQATEAVELVQRLNPELAVVELGSRSAERLATIGTIRLNAPSVRILAAATDRDDETLALAAFKAGADGYLSRSTNPAVLPPLLLLAAGLSVVPRGLMRTLLEAVPPGREVIEGLSPDEITLWTCLAEGIRTGEIAERLGVSDRTVKRLVANLLHRLDAPNRPQAAAMAGRLGLVDMPSAPANPPPAG